MHSPSHYTALADKYESVQNWKMVIACYNSARAASIGHKRRDRYEQYADEIAEKYGVERHHKYVTDYLGNEGTDNE